MPFLLTYSTQSAWLTDAGVPLATIGLLSELTLAYKFKFLGRHSSINTIRRCLGARSGAARLVDRSYSRRYGHAGRHRLW